MQGAQQYFGGANEQQQKTDAKSTDPDTEKEKKTVSEQNNENYTEVEKDNKKRIKVSPRAKLLDHKVKNWSWYNKFNNRQNK